VKENEASLYSRFVFSSFLQSLAGEGAFSLLLLSSAPFLFSSSFSTYRGEK